MVPKAATTRGLLLLSLLPAALPFGVGWQLPAAHHKLHALPWQTRPSPPVGVYRPMQPKIGGRPLPCHPLQMSGKGFGKAGASGGGGERAASSTGREEGGEMEAVMYLPMEYLKIAPLRMFLGFWVMGKKDWKGGQGDDGSLMCAKDDGSGGALIEFRDEKMEGGPSIVVWRVGGGSLGYRLQEAVLLHGLLDELESLVKDDAVEEDKKLFKLKEEGGIAFVREGLPAKPAV